MKKADFVTLILSTIGGVLFALGMCMCLVTEWGSFDAGVILGAAGLVVLLAMVIIRRKMLGKPPVKLTARAVGIAALAAAGALALGVVKLSRERVLVQGVGMCMVMVWENMLIAGVVVGLVGIVLLLSLLPVCKGLK